MDGSSYIGGAGLFHQPERFFGIARPLVEVHRAALQFARRGRRPGVKCRNRRLRSDTGPWSPIRTASPGCRWRGRFHLPAPMKALRPRPGCRIRRASLPGGFRTVDHEERIVRILAFFAPVYGGVPVSGRTVVSEVLDAVRGIARANEIFMVGSRRAAPVRSLLRERLFVLFPRSRDRNSRITW